jgi:hypothetical protein
MTVEPDFESVQPRLQARFARLPEETTWVRLAAVRGLPPYLEAARGSVIGRWVGGLGAGSDAHAIDHACRRLLLEAIEEAAHWVPAPWAEAVRWVRWVVYLGEVEGWLRGGAPPPWADDAPMLAATLVPQAPGGEREIAGEGEVFLTAFRAGDPLFSAWAEGWRRRWPSCSEESLAGLGALSALVARHGARFPGAAVGEAWGARRALRESVRYLFRRMSQSPAAVFAFLLMLALDLERLRADLTRRALFPLPEAA